MMASRNSLLTMIYWPTNTAPMLVLLLQNLFWSMTQLKSSINRPAHFLPIHIQKTFCNLRKPLKRPSRGIMANGTGAKNVGFSRWCWPIFIQEIWKPLAANSEGFTKTPILTISGTNCCSSSRTARSIRPGKAGNSLFNFYRKKLTYIFKMVKSRK